MTRHTFLFDLDGTLVDTITLYGVAVLETLREMGIEETWEHFREWYSYPVHAEQILRMHGKDPALLLSAFRERRDEIYIELLRTKSQWLPGAKELLDSLTPAPRSSSSGSTHKRLRSEVGPAIITGSWMRYVDAIDDCLGVKKHFPVIITCGDMGKFMKPHPHGLLMAADRLGVDPKDCVYIGDQRFDVDAAKAAGMGAWLVRGEWTPEKIEGADRVFGALKEVMAAV